MQEGALSSSISDQEEGWADFADSLRTLVDKAYPDLEDNAKEQLALNHFVSQIENCQVAFSVMQAKASENSR